MIGRVDWSWAVADVRGDFVPAGPDYKSGTTGDSHFRNQAPRSLEAPKGSTTYNPRPDLGLLVIRCNQNLIDHEEIPRAIRNFKEDFGEQARAVDILVSAEVMALEGLWLVNVGFDRMPDENTGMFRWRQILTDAALKRWRSVERELEKDKKAGKTTF